MQLEYSISNDVYAFTALREEQIPCEVIVAHQVHGNAVAVVDRPGISRGELEGYDALVTNLRNVSIGVRTADCIPIFLYDRKRKAVAAIHSGWKGTLQRISHSTLLMMRSSFGTIPEDVDAVIGPGICVGCYQIGEEIANVYKETGFPINLVYQWCGGKIDGDISTGHHLDLVAANRWLLEQAGVRPERITESGICTYEDKRLYSARREGSECGRNINAIMLL